MKTTSANLRTHLDGRVTSLCTIGRITRTDGVNLYFTDHDVPIPFDDGDGLATYESSYAYTRTAVSNNVGLSVDNMDWEGIFDSAAITEDDLRAGLYDYAEVKVSIINWAAPADGVLKMRRGKLGEAVSTPQGIWRAELRGLTQLLAQSIIESYQAECRTDLGSTKCTIPIRPAVLGRSAAAVVGEFYRVPTAGAGIVYGNLLVNPNFEHDTAVSTTVAGWTIASGGWEVVTGEGSLVPKDRTNFLVGGANASGTLTQTIDLLDLGILQADIDAGDFDVDFSIWRANADGALVDTGRVLVQALDALDAPTATIYDSTTEAISPVDTWVSRSATGIALPATSTQLKVSLFHTAVAGDSESAFDFASLTITNTVDNPTTQEVYENRVYEVIRADGVTAGSQPTYDETIGNSTEDGYVAATGALTLAGNAADTETVTIGTHVYTFNTVLGGADSILIGALATDSIDNLIAAINGDAGAGTLYGTGTVANTDVSAAAGTGDTMDVTALVTGTDANSTATTETLATGGSQWASATLSGGVDGVELTARDSFTRHGDVVDVIDRLNMEIAVTDVRAVDDWFDGGAIAFESGDADGIVIEIADWIEATGSLRLFLATPFAILPGTKVRLYPGCDKKIATCIARFNNVLNFRGEPHIPGQDAIMSYPDAR